MLSKVFDIAKRSLSQYQYALNVTSHNIANAQNADYTKQRVSFATEKAEIVGGLEWGSGTKIDDVIRMKNDLIENQILAYTNKESGSSQRSEYLSQIESLYSEPSDLGLSKLMTEFFNSWHELAVSPNSNSLRANLVQTTEKMSNKFEMITAGMTQIKKDIKTEAEDMVMSLNKGLKEITDLNKKIFEQKTLGTNANDLSDQRDKLIREALQFANTQVTYDKEGSAQLSVGGVFAADKYTTVQFQVNETAAGKLYVSATNNDSARITFLDGKLDAALKTYNDFIPTYQNKLDETAKVIVDNVNNLHAQGYTLHDPPIGGTTVSDPNANLFFDKYDKGKLFISEKILNDYNYIAASADGLSGNGEIALKIANLNSDKIYSGKTLPETYQSFIVTLGNDKKSSDQAQEANRLVLDQLEQQKSSVSGVSTDEEMTNIIQYQRSYQASARLIKAADEMLQTLLSMV